MEDYIIRKRSTGEYLDTELDFNSDIDEAWLLTEEGECEDDFVRVVIVSCLNEKGADWLKNEISELELCKTDFKDVIVCRSSLLEDYTELMKNY